jgi:ABC-type lipoprotein release transport system permease subunit
MYQPLLTSRYLTTRMIPLLAVAAVALCVALVVVVISVMTGFLNMVRSSGQTLMGDVVISYPIRGIPQYDLLIATIQEHPEIVAATPVVDTWGLLRMPYPEGDAKESEQVQIWGIEPESFSAVTGFSDTLQWKNIPDNVSADVLQDVFDQRSEEVAVTVVPLLDEQHRMALLRATYHEEIEDDALIRHLITIASDREWAQRIGWFLRNGIDHSDVLGEEAIAALQVLEPRLYDSEQLRLDGITLTQRGRPAMVPGRHVSKANIRTSTGEYRVAAGGYWWLPRFEGTLTTLPIDSRGGMLEPESIVLPFANEFASGVYLIDQTRVMVPLDVVQQMTHLDEAELVDEDDLTTVIGTSPARATMVLVRGQDGIPATEIRDIVQEAYRSFQAKCVAQDLPEIEQPPRLDRDPGLRILTWEEQNASFIGPVEKERELMRTLFSIVYLVCGALIVAIFWAIVYEKTRDIGILRSVGASRTGIVFIFLLYGLFVGVFGALTGVGLGWLITTNMPTIHDAMSEPPLWLGVVLVSASGLLVVWTGLHWRDRKLLPLLLGVLGAVVLGGIGVGELMLRQSGGVVLWDPAVYYFTDIPSEVDWASAWITAGAAALCSVIAAAIPAARAADIDPVGALRYE